MDIMSISFIYAANGRVMNMPKFISKTGIKNIIEKKDDVWQKLHWSH